MLTGGLRERAMPTWFCSGFGFFPSSHAALAWPAAFTASWTGHQHVDGGVDAREAAQGQVSRADYVRLQSTALLHTVSNAGTVKLAFAFPQSGAKSATLAVTLDQDETVQRGRRWLRSERSARLESEPSFSLTRIARNRESCPIVRRARAGFADALGVCAKGCADLAPQVSRLPREC
jgi:hypothetical protein